MPVTNPPLFNWWEVRKERQHPPSAGNIDLIFQIIQWDAMGGPHHQGFWKGVWCDTYKGSLISLASPAILCQRLTQILLKTNVLSSGSQSHFRHITALRTSIVIIIELQSSPRATKADTKVWGKQNNFFQAREISFIKIWDLLTSVCKLSSPYITRKE